MVHVVKTNSISISKFEIVRTVFSKPNARGDGGLTTRREIVKRITKFESFEACSEEDRLKARGLVAAVREAINAKDAFTRMNQAREAQREVAQAVHRSGGLIQTVACNIPH